VTLHIDLYQGNRKLGITVLAQKFIERDTWHNKIGTPVARSIANNVRSRVDASMALKAYLTVAIGEGNFVNLKIKLIPSKVLTGTCGSLRIRLKQNRIFYRIG